VVDGVPIDSVTTIVTIVSEHLCLYCLQNKTKNLYIQNLKKKRDGFGWLRDGFGWLGITVSWLTYSEP
jgi:hypothetical protein